MKPQSNAIVQRIPEPEGEISRTRLRGRWIFLRRIIANPWKVVACVYGILGVWDAIAAPLIWRSDTERPSLVAVLSHWWTWQIWLIGALALLLALVFEGAFRDHRSALERSSAETRARQVRKLFHAAIADYCAITDRSGDIQPALILWTGKLASLTSAAFAEQGRSFADISTLHLLLNAASRKPSLRNEAVSRFQLAINNIYPSDLEAEWVSFEEDWANWTA